MLVFPSLSTSASYRISFPGRARKHRHVFSFTWPDNERPIVNFWPEGIRSVFDEKERRTEKKKFIKKSNCKKSATTFLLL